MNMFLLLLLFGLLIVLFVFNKRQKQAPKRTETASNRSVVSKSTPAKSAHVDDSDDEDVYIDTAEEVNWDVGSNNATVSVETVDTLTEYKVYKQFGYHQKAAESLASYLRSNHGLSSAVQNTLVMELSALWIEAKQTDELADVITEYQELLSQSDAEQLIKKGLEGDNNHLGLRVLAEEILGWGVSKTSRELGLKQDEAAMQPAGAASTDAADEEAELVAVQPHHKLVEGDADTWQISDDERDVLLGFYRPEKGYRMLKGQLVYDSAISCLNKAIKDSDKPASLIIDALDLDYRNNQLGVFAQHLWRLYYTLGSHGARVKERMLGWGYNLGHHAMFDQLETNPNEQQLREIGLAQGYITRGSSIEKAKRRSLVDTAPSEDFVAESPVERILQDAESLLTYGQLDHAMELLETSIMESPQESPLYIALFDLYERAEDWPRLEKMLLQIREKVKTPPEEVVLAMSQLLQRINNK